jgi:tetratricopeptide (TPR) repeat protein
MTLAKEYFSKIIAMNTPYYRKTFSYAYFYLDDSQKAISILQTKIDKSKIGSSLGNAYADFSCLYSLMNEKTKSLTYLEKAFKNEYENYYPFDEMEEYDNIRNTPEFKALRKKYSSSF